MSLIVADSGCDLRTQEVRVPFARVPLRIVVGGTEYEDTESLDIRAMMDHVYAFNGKTGTACPGPGEWAHCFRQDRECYALPISKGVSGSYDSAMIARDLVLEEDPTRKIHIIDARTAGPGMDLIAEKLQELIESGLPFEEICQQVDAYACHSDLLFLLNSLENFVKNGRISRVAGVTAKLLGIKILGAPSPAGELALLHKCRGKARAFDTVMSELEVRGYQGGKMVIGHAFQPGDAAAMRQRVLERWPGAQVEVLAMSGLCCYYAEEGGVPFGFERESERPQ